MVEEGKSSSHIPLLNAEQCWRPTFAKSSRTSAALINSYLFGDIKKFNFSLQAEVTAVTTLLFHGKLPN